MSWSPQTGNFIRSGQLHNSAPPPSPILLDPDPGPASASDLLQLQRASVGQRPPAPPPPCPRSNADWKTRHNTSAPGEGGGWILSVPPICPQVLEQILRMAAPPGSLPCHTPHRTSPKRPTLPSFIQYSLSTYLVPILVPRTGNMTRSKTDKVCVSSRSSQSSRNTAPNQQTNR